ncbi:MAG: toxin-antitoxin system HicB family antitoxin [Chloroflexi bacterium]|nr:toxin-antitoxin system HicB family antitoxin [Chloroflexota bacterium]
MKLEIDGVFTAFDDALALVGDEAERERVRLVLTAGRDSVRRATAEVVRHALDEVNATAAGLVNAQLVYGADGIELRVERNSPAAAASGSDHEFEFVFDTDDIDRLTLRIPAELKEIASRAADQAGISLNAWLTGLLTREAAHRARSGDRQGRTGGRTPPRGPGQSLKGWIGD